MDGLARFSQTIEAAQAQLSASSTFLGAYGMTFNRNKCRHTLVNCDPPRALHVMGDPPLTVRLYHAQRKETRLSTWCTTFV
jgi:hypothetical protein